MTVSQTAQRLHVTRQRVLQYMKMTPPIFERTRIGSLHLLSRASVDAFAAQRLQHRHSHEQQS
jgi:hypothetical protein